MTGKMPARYLLQRDYGQGFVTIREYASRGYAIIELRRLRTFRKHHPVRLFDKLLHKEIQA